MSRPPPKAGGAAATPPPSQPTDSGRRQQELDTRTPGSPPVKVYTKTWSARPPRLPHLTARSGRSIGVAQVAGLKLTSSVEPATDTCHALARLPIRP